MKVYPSAWISGIFVGQLIVVFAVVAFGQTPTATPVPGDITREPSADGTYQMLVEINPADIDSVTEACCYRVDVAPIIPLGCGDMRVVDNDQVITFSVSIDKTAGDDGEVRCNTVNPEDQSAASHNAYIIPFPAAPLAPIVR